jgi:hypothetical protein
MQRDAEAGFTMKKTVSDVETHRYSGGGKDYSIASAEAKIGEAPGPLVMVCYEGHSTSDC